MKDRDREVAEATGTRAVNWIVTGKIDGIDYSFRYYACKSAEAVAAFRRRYRSAEDVRVERSLF